MRKKTRKIMALATGFFLFVIAGWFILNAINDKGELDMSSHREKIEQEQVKSGMGAKGLNHLAGEKSPYLIQHADNPVDWYPWGEEAFAKARSENKPIFLSIGYSTCHWCHVMEHESFEDHEVAALMNDVFISIKVDREERPDIDQIYMTVCQIMTGGGGWPLTIIMTPEKKPFFAATYIPKHDSYGRLGMLSLIPRIKELWQKRREEAVESADRVVNALKQIMSRGEKSKLEGSLIDEGFSQLAMRFDAVNGGFGTAPKFPTPHNLIFLLRYWKRTGNEEALQMVDKTLQSMRKGGVYDQVGFGFHRYSTDAKWFVPHFEKMLYDQALLALAYTEAYQATRNLDYKKTAEEILIYVLSEMKSPQGGFYSAEDADSEGKEGKFYLWTRSEVRNILNDDEARIVERVFGVTEKGDYAENSSANDGRLNILHIVEPMSKSADAIGISEEELLLGVEEARKKLLSVRERRVHPSKDDKILTDWNGLMIAALSRAGKVFSRDDFLHNARNTADFFLDNMKNNRGRLLHRYRSGEASIMGNLNDYAFLIWGLLELYEANYDTRYLEQALQLSSAQIDYFWDDEDGGFFFTPSDGEELLVRSKENYDGAMPSASSVSMMDLLYLGRITGNTELIDRAEVAGASASQDIIKNPAAHTYWLAALEFATGLSVELVIVGERGDRQTEDMLKSVNQIYLPGMVLILKTDKNDKSLSQLAAFTEKLEAKSGSATAYVCRNFACDLPTTSIQEMIDKLE